MNCINCDSSNTSVSNSRPYSEGKSCKRTIVCKDCGNQFNTFEISQTSLDQLISLKKLNTNLPLRILDSSEDIKNRLDLLSEEIKILKDEF